MVLLESHDIENTIPEQMLACASAVPQTCNVKKVNKSVPQDYLGSMFERL